jgi:hypothetical protein
MKKALCVLVVLACVALAASFGNAGNTVAPPMIIANKRFVNQTVPIPATTIVTPTHDSVYRVSVYVTLSRTDPRSLSTWAYIMNWGDLGGSENGLYMWKQDAGAGQFIDVNGQEDGGLSKTIAVSAGMPLTFTVTQNGPADNSAYSLYLVVEQLQ